MPVVEYRFRTCDDAPSSSFEWMRQLGIAVATAAWVLPEDTLEIFVGTVPNGLVTSAELVALRLSHGAEALEAALRAAGASRFVSARICDELDPRIVPFGFLHARTLVRPFWHGSANEAALRNYTGLATICSRDDEDDEQLRLCFGAADLIDRLRAFVGPSRAVATATRTSLARTTCRRPSRSQ